MADGDISERIGNVPKEDLNGFKDAFHRLGVEGCKQFLEAKETEWRTVPLDVGVIGGSGIGKSSFINSIRHITAEDLGSATVDAVECTMTISKYQHPDNPLLQFWDLPGVGTEKFRQEEYLAKIGVEQFDFFLILSASRFTSIDVWLGKELAARGKNFFFVRTKIHDDVESHKKSKPRSHDVPALLTKIRDDLKKNLENDVKFFLIDSYETTLYDFDDLEVQLLQDFPVLKRVALFNTMGAHSEKMIRAKVKLLRDGIWRVCAFSGAVALLPVPLLSLGCDTALVVHQSAYYIKQLGLDDQSLRKKADLTGCDYESLRQIRTSNSVLGTITLGSVKELTKVVAVEAAVEEAARYVPVLGSVLAATISYGTTYRTLDRVLSDTEQVALEVIRVVVQKSAANAASA